jgi:hypothetical protein
MINLLLRTKESRSNRAKAVLIRNSKSCRDIEVTKEELDAAFLRARKRKMTRREQEGQLVSFVWGNAPEGNQGTLETVRKNLNLDYS